MTIPLSTSAATAFRLAVEDDGTAPIGRMMSAWNIIDRRVERHRLDDLPDGLVRQGDRVASSTPLEPLRLGMDEILSESLRLVAEHRFIEEGWYNLSDVAPVAIGLGVKEAMAAAGEVGTFTAYVRRHPLIETRVQDDLFMLRYGTEGVTPGPSPVVTDATCPGDDEPRRLKDATTFGKAYRALLALDGMLIADGTTVRFHRDGDERTATFDAATAKWKREDGTDLRRIDPSDPVMHAYRHGHLVDAVIGFVSTTKSGRVYANVGIPYDSHGDDDAFIATVERKEARDHEDAIAMLEERDDLDHLFRGTTTGNRMMGSWLSGLND